MGNPEAPFGRGTDERGVPKADTQRDASRPMPPELQPPTVPSKESLSKQPVVQAMGCLGFLLVLWLGAAGINWLIDVATPGSTGPSPGTPRISVPTGREKVDLEALCVAALLERAQNPGSLRVREMEGPEPMERGGWGFYLRIDSKNLLGQTVENQAFCEVTDDVVTTRVF